MSALAKPKKVWYLRRLDLFATMSDRDLANLAAHFDDHSVPAGVELLGHRRRGQLYLIKEGVVRISVGEGTDAVTVALLGPGRLFGSSSTVGDDAATIQATAVTPSYVCITSWPRLGDLLTRHPAVLLRLIRALAQQIFRIERWHERFGAPPPRERLADLLRELADEFGEPAAGGRRIPFRLTRADLARMVGTARETTSRVMAEFERTGWIRRVDGCLIVGSAVGGATSDTGNEPLPPVGVGLSVAAAGEGATDAGHRGA